MVSLPVSALAFGLSVREQKASMADDTLWRVEEFLQFVVGRVLGSLGGNALLNEIIDRVFYYFAVASLRRTPAGQIQWTSLGD